MAWQRKQYSSEFKLKVVLEGLQRDTTLEEVCRKFEVSSSMVRRFSREERKLKPPSASRRIERSNKAMSQGSRPMILKSGSGS